MKEIHPPEIPDVALTKFLNFKQTPNMSVQEFYDSASDLSLGLLPLLVYHKLWHNRVEKQCYTMLLGNLAPEIRKGVISKDPKTPAEILKYARFKEKAWRSVILSTPKM